MTSNQLPIHSYDEDIRDLTAAIEQLRLAQARLDTVVTIVERNIDRRVTQEEPARTQETRLRTRRRAVHPSSIFVVGDYVKVKNPRQGQPDRGIVFGATRSALVRVRAANGEEVKRLSKNLTLLESADERERAETRRSGNNIGQ